MSTKPDADRANAAAMMEAARKRLPRSVTAQIAMTTAIVAVERKKNLDNHIRADISLAAIKFFESVIHAETIKVLFESLTEPLDSSTTVAEVISAIAHIGADCEEKVSRSAMILQNLVELLKDEKEPTDAKL